MYQYLSYQLSKASSLAVGCFGLIAFFLLFNIVPTYSQIRILNKQHVTESIRIDTTRLKTVLPESYPQKIALIIGNSEYVEGNQLRDPINNADAVAETMAGLGFDVTVHKNLDRDALRRVIASYTRKARHASTVFVYYSGHTVKHEGVNYLVPIDATLENEDQVKTETIRLDYLIRRLNQNTLLRISIDSCYPNTFGIGQVDFANELCFEPPAQLPKDVFISFTAFENQLAPTVDDKKSSLFSYIFSFNLQQKLVLESFMESKRLVKKLSSGKQDLYNYGTLTEWEYWGPFQVMAQKSSQLGQKKFAWPPPFTSAREEIDTVYFSGSKTLGDVNRRLIAALDDQGYTETSHYIIQEDDTDGFAIATQMEQINSDASTDATDRWNSSLISDTADFSLTQYLKSLFFPRKGYFRVIVFAVVNKEFSTQGDLTKDQAISWVTAGDSNLSKTLAKKSAEGFHVHALIYEYLLTENNVSAEIQKPCDHNGRIHLEKSGLWTQLTGTH